jgi:hypothetical protein
MWGDQIRGGLGTLNLDFILRGCGDLEREDV